MHDDADVEFLVCTRVADIRGAIEHSVTARCTECQAVIVIAPSGVQLLHRQPTLRPVCSVCYTEWHRINSLHAVMTPTAEQLAELLRYFQQHLDTKEDRS
jgi:hypothetical protein